MLGALKKESAMTNSSDKTNSSNSGDKINISAEISRLFSLVSRNTWGSFPG